MDELNLPMCIHELSIKCEEGGRLQSIQRHGYHVKQFLRQELLTPNGAKFLIQCGERSLPASDGTEVPADQQGMPTAAVFNELSVEDKKGIARFYIHAGIEFPDWMRDGIRGLDLRRDRERIHCFGFDVNERAEDNLREKMEEFVRYCRDEFRFSLGMTAFLEEVSHYVTPPVPNPIPLVRVVVVVFPSTTILELGAGCTTVDPQLTPSTAVRLNELQGTRGNLTVKV